MPVFSHQKHRLFYTVSGHGPPVVLIHGLSGSRLWWRRNIPLLQKEFRVYTLDLVGFGASRRQRVLPLQQSGELIGAWLESLGLEQVCLIGHSMGAHTALHVALKAPQRIAGMVLVAASVLVSGNWWSLAQQLPQAGLNGALDFLPTLAFDALRAGLPNLLQATQEILTDRPLEQLAQLSIPTLLVWGERDVLVPRRLGEQLQAALPGSRLEVIAGAGHNVMYDRAAAFNRMVVPFLRDPRSGTVKP